MYVIIFLLAAAQLALFFSVAFLIPEPDNAESIVAITFGVFHADIALLSLWAVFGQRPARIRLTVCVIALFLLVAVFCAYVDRTGGPDAVYLVSSGAIFVHWIAMMIPFWLTRKSGWMIAKAGGEYAERARESQFHIRHLFVWTTAIAVLFAVGNGLSGKIAQLNLSDSAEWSAFFGIITAANVLMAGPLVWATLAAQVSLIWIGVATASIGMLTPLEAKFFGEVPIGQNLLEHGIRFISLISMTHAATIVITLMLVRRYGWRLVQETATADL